LCLQFLGVLGFLFQSVLEVEKDNPEEYLHKELYPVICAWGKAKELSNIYLCPSLSFREDLVG